MLDSTWAKIDKRVKLMKDRNDKMDETAGLLRWDDDPYELVKPDGETKLRDAISVTPNLPKIFAHSVVSDLLTGEWQTIVEGNVSGRQAHLIESFVDDSFAQADDFLFNEYSIPALFNWLCNHVCVRWAIGARWISQVVDGEYKIDCLPVDMRWTPFLQGKWVAPITFRSKDDLEQELEGYEQAAKDGNGEYTKVTLTKEKDIEARDYWDSEKNEIWIEKKLVYSRKNPFGYPPFVIVIPSSGFMLRDKGYLKYEGEDILFLNAGLYKELARSISLEQTSGYAGLYPAYEKEVDIPDASPSQPVPKIDESLDVKKGERHIPVPRGDINRAGMSARADIQGMVDRGAPISPPQYHTPPSAVLLAGEAELISKLQNTRKEALGIFRSQLARMMIAQFVDAGESELLIGKKGRRVRYSASALGKSDEYTISYHLSVKSKRQELANLAEFAAVYDKLPLTWTLPNILMADNPDKIINELAIQQAKSSNPAIGLLEMAVKYAREAKDMEDEVEADLMKEQSRILTHEYVMAMRQRTQSPEIEQPKGNTQLLNSLAVGAMRGEGNQGIRSRQPEEVV